MSRIETQKSNRDIKNYNVVSISGNATENGEKNGNWTKFVWNFSEKSLRNLIMSLMPHYFFPLTGSLKRYEENDALKSQQ